MSSRKRRHNTPPELPPRRSTRGTTASIAEPVYRVVIGLDAGTVNGTAAFWRTLIDAPHKPVGIRDIEYVEKYPDKKTFSNFHNGSRTIPMQILYGETPKHEKRIGWGIFLEQSRQSTWINQNLDRLLSGFKILLDESDALKVPRDELRRKVALLKEQDFINEEEDIFEDFFKIWLKYIRMKRPETCVPHPEFVLCAPTSWGTKSKQKWYSALDRAIKSVWKTFDDQHQSFIYTCSEPAAASSYAVAEMKEETHVSRQCIPF